MKAKMRVEVRIHDEWVHLVALNTHHHSLHSCFCTTEFYHQAGTGIDTRIVHSEGTFQSILSYITQMQTEALASDILADEVEKHTSY